MSSIVVCTVMFLLLFSSFPDAAARGKHRTKINQWSTYFLEGEKYLEKGNLKKAQEAFLKSLWGKGDTEKARSYIKLAEISDALGKTSEAELFFKESLRAAETRQGRHGYAAFLVKQGRLDEAKSLDLVDENRIESFPPDIKDVK